MAIDNESIADEFGEKIAQALRDRAAWRHLPPGFAAWRPSQRGPPHQLKILWKKSKERTI